jgi:hypothetical protein
MADEEARTYSGNEVMAMLGISYRQFDYWIRRLGWEQHQRGSGTQRRLTDDEVAVLRRLADLRKQSEAIARKVEHLFTVSRADAQRPKEVV